MDSMLGFEDDVVGEGERPGEVWGHLETEQNQGNGHLQLEHGKVLPNAVPADMEARRRVWLQEIVFLLTL
jgi:hypothetical protein